MKIVIAPDSFKGSLTALEACEAIKEGVLRACPDAEVVSVPMADGGEGTVQSLVDATGGELIRLKVTGPLGEPVDAFYGILGDGETAVIEMAAASGLPLVPEGKRDPRITTTYGTGELIRAALDRGARKFILGIGGSATNDGGSGVAEALGVRLLDEAGKPIGRGGAELARLASIDMSTMDPRVKEIEMVVACDVDNPLCGPRGAAAVYGPQKGATPEMVKELDAALANFAEVVRRDLGKDVKDVPGAGAAGGLGAGLVAFFGANLRRGVDIVIEATGLSEKVAGADLVITGEGKVDFQTAFGKTPQGVAKTAKKHGVPVVAIAGGIGDGAEVVYQHGIDSVVSIVRRPMSLKEAMENARTLMADTAEAVVRLFMAGRGTRQATLS